MTRIQRIYSQNSCLSNHRGCVQCLKSNFLHSLKAKMQINLTKLNCFYQQHWLWSSQFTPSDDFYYNNFLIDKCLPIVNSSWIGTFIFYMRKSCLPLTCSNQDLSYLANNVDLDQMAFKKPSGLELYFLSLSLWICSKKLHQVIWPVDRHGASGCVKLIHLAH